MTRSDDGTPTGFVTTAVLLPWLTTGSFGLDTTAVTVTLDGALAATFTVSVICGNALPPNRMSDLVQVSVASTQVQPGPVIDVAVRLGGSVTTTVTGPI